MRFFDLLHMSSSNLWKRKIRTILTILGVIIGTASIVVMISLGLGLNKTMMDSFESYGGLTTINVYKNDGGGSFGNGMAVAVSVGTENNDGKKEEKFLDDKLVEQIKNIPHVELVSPVLSFQTIARQGAYEHSWFNLKGMTLEALQDKKIPLKEGSLPEAGAPLTLIVGNAVIEEFRNPKKNTGSFWETGVLPDIDFMNKTLFVIFDTDAYQQSQQNSRPESAAPGSTKKTAPPKKYMVHTSALVADAEGMNKYNEFSWDVYCDIEALKSHLKKVFKNRAIPGQPTKKGNKPYKNIFYDSIYVNVDNMDYVEEVAAIINQMGYRAENNISWVKSSQEQSRGVQAALGGIGAVSLFVAAIGITNTMMMSIYERTKEIGVIKVLGCALSNIRTLFLLEAAYIGFIGGLVGVGLSYAISAIINKVASSMGSYASTTSYIPPWLAGVALIFAVLVGMVAGFFPALRAMKLSPLAAIRNE